MRRFYLLLWLHWLVRVVLCTLLIAAVGSALATLFIYIKQGSQPIDEAVSAALFDIWYFWFVLSLNIALLFVLFRSVKYLFNRCHAGYVLRLKVCEAKEEFIDPVGYGDLVKVWRKWFMLLIWLVGALMVLAVAFTYIFTSYTTLFAWFNIYILYLFIALGAYLSFIFLIARCKAIKVVKCSSL